MKKTLTTLITLLALTFAASTASADHHMEKESKMAPKSVIHVVTVSWKADATPAQIKAALDGVHTLAKEYPGITRVWTRTIKAQGNRGAAFVMEFASEKALADYAGSDAQKKWYESYYPAREGSTTFDISN
ncbi:Dabb family protein [Synoicihabitans lomoniglobus]|uniref:Dabb family protein n=1 Tax=Synoicihabitans lomoniglobus TaxID=2909285 RepID=A0AAE9ZTG5_9BACT|nr:Dabb family protein [Opitutaceae bacterium LMO-M01]WED63011.1 Dabb family protein [Opitutaceae bacterium LMO-M01]